MFAELVVTTEPPVETVSVTLLAVFVHVIVCHCAVVQAGARVQRGPGHRADEHALSLGDVLTREELDLEHVARGRGPHEVEVIRPCAGHSRCVDLHGGGDVVGTGRERGAVRHRDAAVDPAEECGAPGEVDVLSDPVMTSGRVGRIRGQRPRRDWSGLGDARPGGHARERHERREHPLPHAWDGERVLPHAFLLLRQACPAPRTPQRKT